MKLSSSSLVLSSFPFVGKWKLRERPSPPDFQSPSLWTVHPGTREKFCSLLQRSYVSKALAVHGTSAFKGSLTQMVRFSIYSSILPHSSYLLHACLRGDRVDNPQSLGSVGLQFSCWNGHSRLFYTYLCQRAGGGGGGLGWAEVFSCKNGLQK